MPVLTITDPHSGSTARIAPELGFNCFEFRVLVDGQWIDVPDDAVITVPNRAGRTMVWPVKGASGILIRCFLPGVMM